MKLTAQQREAKEAIWYSLDITRGRMDAPNSLNLSLFILLWAKFIPQSKKDIIGYFDVLEGIDHYRIERIQNELQTLTGINLSEFIFRDELTRDLETLRVTLLPVAKLIAKGDIEDIDSIVRSFKSFTSTLLSKKGSNEINEGILNFSKMIFDDIEGNNKEMNCLYPGGTSAAYNFAKERKTYLFENNRGHAFLNKGLLSLYGYPFKFEEYNDKEQEITFAAPPIGLKLGLEGFHKIWEFICPFVESEDSELISDLHCKMMYLAHENTKDTSILMTSSVTLFSNQNGINFFRKKIIDNNWLDAIIKFPQMSYSGTAIAAVMLILKKRRSENKKVQFIDFSSCENNSPNRFSLDIPNSEINKLFLIYKNEKITNISNSISTNEIKKNDYNLNLSKYILSEDQKTITNLLKKRETVPLSSLVNFIRPLKINSIKTKNGPEINEVLISDINYIGEISGTDKKTKVSEEFLSRSNLPLVKKDDLVISIKGTLGKIGYISKDLDNTVPGPSLCVLRPQGSAIVGGEYIFQYLRSEIGQKIISSSSQAVSVSFISINDLKNLPIPIPSPIEQKKAKIISKRSKELAETIHDMQKELDRCTSNGWLQIDKKNREEKE